MCDRKHGGEIALLAAMLSVLWWGSAALGQTNLTKGHRLLLKHGLQIQAQVFVDSSWSWTLDRWKQSNFTTVNWQWGVPIRYYGTAPGFPWARWTGDASYIAPATDERPFLANYISLQYLDEPTLSDPAAQQKLATWYAQARGNFPNTLLFTNLQGNSDKPADIATFMSKCKPDMLMYDSYPIAQTITITGGSMKTLYEDLAKFRTLGLAGNDGTGSHPIPVGHYMENFTDHHYEPRLASESETRLSQFAGWTFGEKFESSFVYDAFNAPNLEAQFFKGLGDANPTPAFSQMAESNRESRNLGPALVRLISTDVRFFPGEHERSSKVDTSTRPADITEKALTPALLRSAGRGGKARRNPTLSRNIQRGGKGPSSAGVLNDVPDGMRTWQAGVGDPYLRSVQVRNTGKINGGLRGDVVIGWFKVLDESMDGPARGQIYFMVLNGLTAAQGSAADCAQRITIQWAFGNSGITGIQRLNRDTGKVQEMPLERASGGQDTMTLLLDGGTADLFKFNTGAPFVGIGAARQQ